MGLGYVANCPEIDCSGVVVVAYHPYNKKHLKDGIWTFTCNNCGKHFPIPEGELREAMLSEAWLTMHYPQTARHPFF